MTFAIGSFLAAVAGILYICQYQSLRPTLGALPGIKAFVAAVLGGIGSVPGAMIGGILLGIIESISKACLLYTSQGLHILEEMMQEMKANNEKTLAGEHAFKLYDTYGFPLDLTKEILEEEGFNVDEEGFKASMEEQRQMARKARKVTNYMGADVTVYEMCIRDSCSPEICVKIR